MFYSKAIEHPVFPLATRFTRQISISGDAARICAVKASLEAAVRNGGVAQPIPITDPGDCNALGQQYGGAGCSWQTSTTYSSGAFLRRLRRQRDGPVICVGSATGAGGANVWEYGELRRALAGSPYALPSLPTGLI